jgi:hypothetical protein
VSQFRHAPPATPSSPTAAVPSPRHRRHGLRPSLVRHAPRAAPAIPSSSIAETLTFPASGSREARNSALMRSITRVASSTRLASVAPDRFLQLQRLARGVVARFERADAQQFRHAIRVQPVVLVGRLSTCCRRLLARRAAAARHGATAPAFLPQTLDVLGLPVRAPRPTMAFAPAATVARMITAPCWSRTHTASVAC